MNIEMKKLQKKQNVSKLGKKQTIREEMKDWTIGEEMRLGKKWDVLWFGNFEETKREKKLREVFYWVLVSKGILESMAKNYSFEK